MVDENIKHGHYLLLLRVRGVDDDTVERWTKEIHREYMRMFVGAGAFTVDHLRLGRAIAAGTNAHEVPEWTHAIRYFGPTGSVQWLQESLETNARDLGGEVTTQTFPVENVTGRY